MKISLKKTLKITAVLFVLIIGSLFAIPAIFKDKIVQKVKDVANENINGELNFKDTDLSFLNTFRL